MKKLKALVFSALFISLAVVPVKAEEETDKKVIACVGDSITYGLVKDPQTGAESGTTYPDDLNLLLGNDYEVVNLGKPGAYVTKDDGTLCMWNQEEYKKALDVKADSFIVMLGTNDSHEESFDEEKFKTSYLEFLESLQESNQVDVESNQVGNEVDTKSNQVEGESNQVEGKSNQVQDSDTRLRHSDTPKVSLSNKQRDIVNFCSVPRTTAEIMERLGLSNQTKNRERYITSLVAAGYLQMTNPENPTASNQKYKKATTK